MHGIVGARQLKENNRSTMRLLLACKHTSLVKPYIDSGPKRTVGQAVEHAWTASRVLEGVVRTRDVSLTSGVCLDELTTITRLRSRVTSR